MLKFHNEKGMTLIEVLAAAVILTFIVITFSYLFTQGAKNSKAEEKRDQSVAIARSLMEEIKTHLIYEDTIQFRSQPINLKAIREAAAPIKISSLSIQYPQDTDETYTVEITADPVSDKTITIEEKIFQLTQYFRLVKIQVTEMQFQTSYTLESYLEYTLPPKE